ncbi:XK-related protein 6 [Pseudolycoriella hygida]|uniref:XK-related protein n=1 Tax=Pseudolycoriella hygida TaxID=35572 RepID=A0A9Q0NG26_9DIPT|nr:XK-related protein 6 [Pseudolycoriella hygida]
MAGQSERISEQPNFIKSHVNQFLQSLSSSPTEEDFTVTYCDIFWTIISVLGRIISILITINVAFNYYRNDQFDYFWWTVICFTVPMLVTTFLQISIYLQDFNASRSSKTPSFCEFLWFVIVFPFLFRYCQTLTYAIASKRAERANKKEEQRKYFELLIHEDSDVALIRIFECFLEAAPQKILQITIILNEGRMNVPQILSILSSFLSMAWCIASYHRCIRFAQVDKANISWWGTIMQWLCHFLVSLSRVLSIAAIASLFPKWTLISCSIHAMLMALWIFLFDASPFCSSSMFLSFSFSLVLGMVFIFNYILPKVGRTRYRYTIFYSICFVENVICVYFFYNFASHDTMEKSYFILICVLAIVPFILGIAFMIIYYTRFHPNIIVRREVDGDQPSESN